MGPHESISTLEVLKALWPILAALAAAMFAQGGLYMMVRHHANQIENNRSELLKLIAENKFEFDKFKAGEYASDKLQILAAIKEVKEAQQRGEDRLEGKLDKMSTETDRKLDSLFEKVNHTNNVLAKIEGRLYAEAQSSKPN